jgi:hypothetical protein
MALVICSVACLYNCVIHCVNYSLASWMSEFIMFKKCTRHTTYGNKVMKLHIEFNFPKFNFRIVVVLRQQQIFLCPLQSFRLELHNNWKRRESIFMLLFRNWACPTASDNELHMALFRCDVRAVLWRRTWIFRFLFIHSTDLQNGSSGNDV